MAGLSASGMTVDWVQTGGQALAALANPTYSVVVLDLGLPDIDGLDVLGRARPTGAAATGADPVGPQPVATPCGRTQPGG
jgi:DNA-binding response OmpR family regulator